MKHSSPTAAVALNDAITALVCRTYWVTPAELASKCRAQHIAWSRFTVWYLLRRLTPLSFPRVGMLVGDVDHSVVIHGINEVKARMRELAARQRETGRANSRPTIEPGRAPANRGFRP